MVHVFYSSIIIFYTFQIVVFPLLPTKYYQHTICTRHLHEVNKQYWVHITGCQNIYTYIYILKSIIFVYENLIKIAVFPVAVTSTRDCTFIWFVYVYGVHHPFHWRYRRNVVNMVSDSVHATKTSITVNTR